MTAYIYEKPSQFAGRRPDYAIDLVRFAKDFAATIGGTVVTKGDYPNVSQEVKVGENVVHLSWQEYGSRDKMRVRVSIAAPDVPWNDRNMYDKTSRTEDATINPDARTMAQIVADVQKRVINTSLEALAKQRQYAQDQAANRAGIVNHANTLKGFVPAASINVDEAKQRARVYISEPYISGTMSHTGDVRIEHLTLSMAKFVKLVKIMNEAD